MAQHIEISTIPTNFYGSPSSPADFPNGLYPCKCKDHYNCICENIEHNIRENLFHMHTAITELGLWNQFVLNPPLDKTGFMFSQHKWINSISKHPMVSNDLHSGSSFGITMRYMEFIATKGWNEFFKTWTLKNTICEEKNTITVIVS